MPILPHPVAIAIVVVVVVGLVVLIVDGIRKGD